MPPFDGPRATLCVTRKPSKTRREPSSIRAGTPTSTHFFTPDRTLIRFGSKEKTSPTSRSWARASSGGFSRRCDGDWVALIVRLRRRSRAPSIRRHRVESPDVESDRPSFDLVGDRCRLEADRVRARRQPPTAWAPPREPEGVLPGQQVSDARDRPEQPV